MIGLWLAVLLGGTPAQCACSCAHVDWSDVDAAVHGTYWRTEDQLAERARALAVMRAELEAILRRNRAAFEEKWR